LEKAKAPFLEQLAGLKAKAKVINDIMAAETKMYNDEIARCGKHMDACKDLLLKDWQDADGNQQEIEGWTFTRNNRKAVVVLDELGLFRQAVAMPVPPVKPKWINKDLIVLIGAGAIDKELATVEVNHFIAVKRPKGE